MFWKKWKKYRTVSLSFLLKWQKLWDDKVTGFTVFVFFFNVKVDPKKHLMGTNLEKANFLLCRTLRWCWWKVNGIWKTLIWKFKLRIVKKLVLSKNFFNQLRTYVVNRMRSIKKTSIVLLVQFLMKRSTLSTLDSKLKNFLYKL